jgi:hypothetical protein
MVLLWHSWGNYLEGIPNLYSLQAWWISIGCTTLTSAIFLSISVGIPIRIAPLFLGVYGERYEQVFAHLIFLLWKLFSSSSHNCFIVWKKDRKKSHLSGSFLRDYNVRLLFLKLLEIPFSRPFWFHPCWFRLEFVSSMLLLIAFIVVRIFPFCVDTSDELIQLPPYDDTIPWWQHDCSLMLLVFHWCV